MADNEGTVLGFPRLTVPGVVAEDRPPAGPPVLAPLATDLAPPASLSIPDNPEISRESEHPAPAGPPLSAGGPANVAAMSAVMMAGITVAALRGAAHFVAYMKARAEHQKTVERQRTPSASAGNPQHVDSRTHIPGVAPRVQSGPEFGRSTRHSAQHSPHTGPQVPATFRQSPTTPGGTPGSRTPEKPLHGRSDGPLGGGGSPGADRVREARRRVLEGSGSTGRQNRLSGGGNSGGGGVAPSSARDRDRSAGRLLRQPAGPDTIRGAARRRMAERITHGPKDRPDKPERSPAGPDTIRGAAGRRVADRITTGSWKPTGAHKPPTGSTPTTIRAALRARAADRILNGRKPKPDSPGDPATPEEQATPAGPPGTDLAVAPGTATAGAKPDGGRSRRGRVKPPKRPRRKRRLVTPGGATGARPWRSRPGQGRASRERPRRDRRRQRTRDAWWFRRYRAPRTEETTPPAGSATSAGGGFAPPPGWAWTEGETITVERADGGPRKPRPPAALGRGQAALPPAPHRTAHARPGTTRPPSPPPPRPVGGQSVSIPLPRATRGAQYVDAELTIYDVIEADADMGEEITQGAAEAKQAASDCEELAGQLERLYAKVLDLKVPGILAPAVVKLMEKTAKVKARAEAIAEKIPAAAEAITAAGDNAAARHKPLADAVRDAGHTAPAERDYHNE